MSRRTFALVALELAAVVAGCGPNEKLSQWDPNSKDYGKPLPPGKLALRKITPDMYPDFGLGFNNKDGLAEAIRNSIAYMHKPSSQKYYPYGDITHARALASLEHFLKVLQTANSPQALHQAVCNEFDVYQSVGCDDQGTVLYTGYYTPIFDGSRQRTETFKYPIYRCPPDLAKDEEGNCTGRRNPDGSVTPGYPTRQEIEQNRLFDGLEIAWLQHPFEAYVITVQGSAKLRLPEGSMYELGYAANNGHTYVPIAMALLSEGKITKEELSLQTLLRFFHSNPTGVTYQYAWKNPRYVFFKEAPGGPFGSLGQPVTPFRSLATDKQIFPRACLAYYQTNLPRPGSQAQGPYASFACDQDTGGAIRAAGRCDVFMGVGQDAEAIAGRTYSEGKLYYIFLKA
jgi:membrane-bound lytic murein transglycosylase A